jgi:hypothetical protein
MSKQKKKILKICPWNFPPSFQLNSKQVRLMAKGFPYDLSEVITPAFMVSLPTLKRNTERMLQRAKDLNVSLRPHVKTHKVLG